MSANSNGFDFAMTISLHFARMPLATEESHVWNDGSCNFREAVGDAEIDTVLVCFQLRGRLVGKRYWAVHRRSATRVACLRLPSGRRHGNGAGAWIPGGVLGQRVR